MDIFYSAGFIELTSLPTREMNSSKYYIGHIFCKHFGFNTLVLCVLKTDVSDHYDHDKN